MIKLSSVAIALLTSVGLVGVAAAGDPKTEKTAPKTDPKMADPKGAPKMDPKMDMTMKPPTELADMAKGMAGTWTCKGQGMGHDMKMTDMTATMTAKLEMSGWWMHETFDAKMGKEPFHFESYTSYDATAKKWNRVMAETGGGYSSGTSAGMTAGKMDWELTSRSPMGEGSFKDHVDASDPKAVKTWGEFSMDKGKTWMKVYEATCKK
jgi:hypothetical protein